MLGGRAHTLAVARRPCVDYVSRVPWDDGLDDIDWASLSHAYGPADDVPGLLRLLASPDAEERSTADWELNGSIVHQGTLYEATAPACGFLGRLAAEVAHSRWTATCDLAYIAGRACATPHPAHYAAIRQACLEAIAPLVEAVDRTDVVQIGAVLALAAACEPLERSAVHLAVARLEEHEDPELKAVTALLLARDPDEAWRLAELRLQLIPGHPDLKTQVSDDRKAEILARLPVAPSWQRTSDRPRAT
jgi:hypothetical protein